MSAPKDPNNLSIKPPLLHAWHDPLASVKTNTSCIKLADLQCDGDSKLCVCDMEKKLRIYKGTGLSMEYSVPDIPTALCVTYTESTLPRIPSIAVAAGPHIFIYRQLKPYRKWTCPSIEVAPAESEVWNSLKSGSVSIPMAMKSLNELRERGTVLTARSNELLLLEKEEQQVTFVDEMKDITLSQPTLITCMDVLKKDSEEMDALSLLVVGTEAGQIFILPQDPINSNTLCKIQLPSPPSLLSISGVFDVEWRVSVVCRDGRLYSIKNGDVRGTALLVGTSVDLPAPAVSMVKQDKSLWIACMDRSVTCYSNRGKRLKGLLLNDDVIELGMISLKRAKLNYLLLVALANSEVHLYKDLTLVYQFSVDKPVQAMVFGMYGREENSLVCITGTGALTIKIWRRTADIETMNFHAGPPPEQDIPLNIPKKTKLYVEQTSRERECGSDMHRAFQRDLCKMRLTTARAYVKTLTDVNLMTTSSIGSQDLRIQAQVHGLGPKFLLKLTLHNTGTSALSQLRLVFSFDVNQYDMGKHSDSHHMLVVPLLLPGSKTNLETFITSIDPQGRAGQVMCFLYQSVPVAQAVNGSVSSTPILTASIRMPVSELIF